MAAAAGLGTETDPKLVAGGDTLLAGSDATPSRVAAVSFVLASISIVCGVLDGHLPTNETKAIKI